MHFPQPAGNRQIALFGPLAHASHSHWDAPATSHTPPAQAFSEIALHASSGNRLQLLGAILRELSLAADGRWLTLVAPPTSVTREWLCIAGINREAILLLQPRNGRRALDLACETLRLGRSHTVVSWLELQAGERALLSRAADQGQSQSLNIRLR